MLQPGSLVFSLVGRDRGRAFLVWDIDERWAYLVDGAGRHRDKPKRKNVKHLQISNQVAKKIAEKLAQLEPVSNQEIRQALKDLAPSANPGQQAEGGEE